MCMVRARPGSMHNAGPDAQIRNRCYNHVVMKPVGRVSNFWFPNETSVARDRMSFVPIAGRQL